MGNKIGKLQLCFAGDAAGEISRRRPHHDIAVYLSDPLDEGLGHSFCYIRPDSTHKLHPISDDDDNPKTMAFRTISGAAISANTFTPLSTALLDFGPYNNFVLEKAASFESSDSFASIPLQPIPRSSIPSIRSGPIQSGRAESMFGSGPIERGFLSGPIERSLTSGPLENQYDQLQRYKPKSKKISLMKILKKSLEKSMSQQTLRASSLNEVSGSGQENEISTTSIGTSSSMSNYLSGQMSLIDCDDEDDEKVSTSSQNLQWAQGKAGEDRVHVVISEENGWDFVGIYDGFNGPDATDFLLNNLYKNVHKELKGILFLDENMPKSILKGESLEKSKSRDDLSSCDMNGSWRRTRGVRKKWDKEREEVDVGIHHSDVLKALSEALRKTEEAYLEIADLMLLENPELALMGSCLLVMLMKGDDVYLMNVGDSRAVLARKEELSDHEDEEFDCFPNLDTCQLSVDHSTSMDEEVRRIKNEHRDDPFAVTSDRVKGSLKVTRAFGAGFLKQPKWNNALLPMFRIDYVGIKPYINCCPSLYHHRLGPRDKFLILSSDGLYQYFTNEEAVNEVEMFMSTCPEGDPAQHLVEQVLFRAAKKAGMDFHELIDIPQGDRRKYHDDVSIIIISFEGRIWRSSV